MSSVSTGDVPKSGTSFLDLPAELRNHIYSFVLPRWSRLQSDWTTDFRIYIGDESRINDYEPALLRCSKQIREETIAMYYNKNGFEFYIRKMDFRSVAY